MKRFTSEQQIINAIDRCHTKSQEMARGAELQDGEADLLFRQAALEADAQQRAALAKTAGELRIKARRLRKRAHSFIENKARKLGRKLAEFRTRLIFAAAPGVGDESIQQ